MEMINYALLISLRACNSGIETSLNKLFAIVNETFSWLKLKEKTFCLADYSIVA